MYVEDHVVRLERRIVELEQRADKMVRHGPVTDVDAEKHLVRLRIGGTDAEPKKSPWTPYGQIAGAMKVHSPPSVGQNMTMFSPTGDFRQAVTLPMTWNNANPSPSQKKDEHILKFGKVTITIKSESLTFDVDGSKIEITKDKIVSTSKDIKDVGKSHLGLKSEDSGTKKAVVEGDEKSPRVLIDNGDLEPESDLTS